MRSRPHFLLVALGLAGCDEPLAYPQDIEDFRVLGAKVSVGNDPSRAWPLPGEHASIEWLVADPEPDAAAGFAFEACPSEASARGIPDCVGPSFAQAAALAPAGSMPRFELDVPSTNAPRLLTRGLVCKGEVPNAGGCSAEHERVMFEIVPGSADRANQNPSLADSAFSLDGAPWPEPSSAVLGQKTCAAGDLPEVPADGAKHEIAFALDESDREPLEDPEGLAPTRETLGVSNFSTRGHLSQPLGVIEAKSSDLGLSVGWRAPKSGAGERVRFYFVVRDGRGGVDWAIRTLCLRP